MPDRPEDMKRNGRPLVPDFEPLEWLYYRIPPTQVQAGGFIDPISVKCPCPAVSSNRASLSEPWHVLYPRDKYGSWAVFKFQRESLPETVRANVDGATTFTIKTEHDPLEENYGHCATRLYRGEEKVKREDQVNPQAKNEFRLRFARALIIERLPGLPFPPTA
jgi:hypothetical protein